MSAPAGPIERAEQGLRRLELDVFRRSESKRMGDIVKAANLEVK